jgi:site-specific recombinase XerD
MKRLSAVPDGPPEPTDSPPGWPDLRASFVLSLRAARRSERTVSTYLEGVDGFAAFLGAHAPGKPVEAATRDDLRGYLVDLAERGRKPSTLATRHGALRALFRVLVEDEIITEDPMRSVKAPQITDQRVPPALTAEQVDAIVRACPPKNTFRGARDRALILVLASSGLRASECLGLTVDDLELDSEMPYVVVRHGKGDRDREAAVSHAAAKALLGYVRQRARLDGSWRPELFLGRTGTPLTTSGLLMVVREAGKRVGLALHTHSLRHTATHQMLERMGEHEVATQLGHRGTRQLSRYGAARAVERSRAAFFRS